MRILRSRGDVIAIEAGPSGLWTDWRWEPGVLVSLVLAAGIYARGVRAPRRGRVMDAWRPWAFAGGLAAAFVALVSPLDAMAESLFAAHMVQHLVLILVAAPLLVLGAPLVALRGALPASWRRALRRGWRTRPGVRAAVAALASPGVIWGAHVVVLWAWHLPGLYDAAVEHDAIHALEHLCFLGTAAAFWWVLLRPDARRRMGEGAAVLYLFVTALQSAALGALLTFASVPLYAVHATTTSAWGLTPLQDQQLAGLIMWVPASVVYVGAALALLARRLGEAGTPALPLSDRAWPGHS